ncbi:muts domain V-domain-containing protein [Rhexocercosporidium sp. MPI-PUGE-AT-0058]|nr:muts domain V-domain-containing protein [Rhexocercosporidium sp. MPI-PUGE-AT-0058]
MYIPYPSLRAIRPRRIPTPQARYFCSLPTSTSSRVPRIQRSSYSACRGQNRGKKTKSSLKIDDLPQGVITLDPLPLEQNAPPSYSTVVQQARTNMRKFENCVLLTRVGGFYELYFEHAEEFASLLNLKEARRPTRPGAPVVPMAGFPFFQLDRYLKILVQDLNRYVAIAEEFPNDVTGKVKAGGLMHDRRVTRIITPGTLIDENFMDPFSNNYVLAIHTTEYSMDELPRDSLPESILAVRESLPIGLAWLDLSTGHFFTQSTTLSNLPSFLARISPREIVLEKDLQASKDHGIFEVLADDHHHLITYTDPSKTKEISEWEPMLESPVPARSIGEFTAEEAAAGSSLLQYVETRLQGSNMKLQPPLRQLDMMGIDKNTMRALEIRKTMKDDLLTGSLLHTVRRTVTKGGARLLDNWLSSPSTSIDVINSRLDLVTNMLNDDLLRERITILLKRSHDSHRLLQKFAFGRGDPDDLLALASTIYATQDIIATLSRASSGDACIQAMISRIDLTGPNELAKRIREAIDEEGIMQQQILEDSEAGEMQALAEAIVTSEGSQEDSSILPKGTRKRKPTSIREHYSDDSEPWIMKPAASPTLTRLHEDILALTAEKAELVSSLSQRLGATTLTLQFRPGLGHICHLKGKDTKLALHSSEDSPIRTLSSSKSTRSFHHPEWTTLGQRIDTCKTHIRAEEHSVFHALRSHTIHNIVKLRRNAAVLDELDIACSFALLASEKRWTKPLLNNTTTHKIIGGRHPTVEGGLEEEGRSFITNDCFVGSAPQKKIWVITGPNMAGKSTFLRQNALITILAQVGSYVPAEYAELGIVDQMFSRVGSADNLYRDQSTFMVEMLETATILKHATPKSFVIMDEIGRGTTPSDGTAVAFACLSHLLRVNGCRTLFATHFHGLVDLLKREGMAGGVGFYCTDVAEDEVGDGFRYVHRLREGVNRRSHALKVARLAGMPEEAIAVARRVLEGEVSNRGKGTDV